MEEEEKFSRKELEEEEEDDSPPSAPIYSISTDSRPLSISDGIKLALSVLVSVPLTGGIRPGAGLGQCPQLEDEATLRPRDVEDL